MNQELTREELRARQAYRSAATGFDGKTGGLVSVGQVRYKVSRKAAKAALRLARKARKQQ